MAASSIPTSPRNPLFSFSEFDFVDSIESLWHYDFVLSPGTAQQLMKAPEQTTLALLEGATVGIAIRELRDEQTPSLQEHVPSVSWNTRHWRPLFRLLDQNNDGEVSLDEMASWLHRLGIEVSQNCLHSLIESLDCNSDKALNYDEFADLCLSLNCKQLDTSTQDSGTQQTEEELDTEDLLDTFNVYDRNKDGYICATELAEVLRDLGFPEGTDLQRCQALINKVDTDGNGLVDLREFKAMLGRSCGLSESSTMRCNDSSLDRRIELICC